ncbi:MAG: hypothetical protein R3350_06480 [Saprospiraceae bacterium]|nr:hypothetical protein [Saprospiraceae bacterium]
MKKIPPQNNDPLGHLFWKDEILQIMYWLRGEQLAEEVKGRKLLTLLNTDAENLLFQLGKLADQGLLSCIDRPPTLESEFSLSEAGKKEAGARFSSAFEGMQKAGHGECSADCDCQWEGHESCQHHHH